MKLHEGMGTLALYADRLVLNRGWQSTDIPFRAVRRFSVASYPFLLSPAGLCSILVEYEEAGKVHHLMLTPSKGMFSFVGDTKRRVAEWFGAIREAITAATGKPPEGSSTPVTYQGFSRDGRVLGGFIIFVSTVGILGILMAPAWTGSWRNLAPAGIPFLFGVAFVSAVAWVRKREWLREHPHPKPPASPAVFPGIMAVSAPITVILLLVLAAMGHTTVMLICAGFFVVIGLFGSGKGQFPVKLIVVLAGLGVAGATAWMLARKPTAPPKQTGSASFGAVIEATLPDPAAGSPCVLDFETGNLLEPPAEIVPVLDHDISQLPPAALRWLRDHGADAVLSADGSVRLIEGVVFNPTLQGKALAWDDFTPSQVSDTVKAMSDEQRRISATQPAFHMVTLRHPAAVVFTTRERSRGILQILGAEDRGLKIRYKLVQDQAASPPLPPGYGKHTPKLPFTTTAQLPGMFSLESLADFATQAKL